MEPHTSKEVVCSDCGRTHPPEQCGLLTPHRPAPSFAELPPTPRKAQRLQASGEGQKRYTCEHCAKGFSSKFKLARHMVVHSRLREWECEACGTGFRRKDHLEAHLRQHCGDRPLYPCPLCPKTYSCKGSLRKHSALHSAQAGVLSCQLCTFVGDSKESILTHVRTHSGSRLSKSPAERKYRCSDCERSFFTRKDASRHSVVHTKARDFLCQFCPRTFGRSDHLGRHIEKAHGGPGTSRSGPVSTEPPQAPNALPGFEQAFRDV